MTYTVKSTLQVRCDAASCGSMSTGQAATASVVVGDAFDRDEVADVVAVAVRGLRETGWKIVVEFIDGHPVAFFYCCTAHARSGLGG